MSSTGEPSVERLPVASVHGRFQPFHNGHLEYLSEALSRCEFLFVGITQHEVKRLVQVVSSDAVHRAEPHSNPLTYYERKSTVDAVMRSLGVASDRYDVLPFPIEEPSQLTDFLPITVPIFTTSYDEWNTTKIRVLEQQGYTVTNLWSRTSKEFAGHEIRSLIRRRDDRWRAMVPSSVESLLDEFDISSRLEALTPSPMGS